MVFFFSWQNQIAPPKQQESSCSLGIDNSGTESATISIKLPPSVLQDQKQLSTIVNTISKALHQPSTENTNNTDQSGANAATEISSQQTYNMKSEMTSTDSNLIGTTTQNWQATSNTTSENEGMKLNRYSNGNLVMYFSPIRM